MSDSSWPLRRVGVNTRNALSLRESTFFLWNIDPFVVDPCAEWSPPGRMDFLLVDIYAHSSIEREGNRDSHWGIRISAPWDLVFLALPLPSSSHAPSVSLSLCSIVTPVDHLKGGSTLDLPGNSPGHQDLSLSGFHSRNLLEWSLARNERKAAIVKISSTRNRGGSTFTRA